MADSAHGNSNGSAKAPMAEEQRAALVAQLAALKAQQQQRQQPQQQHPPPVMKYGYTDSGEGGYNGADDDDGDGAAEEAFLEALEADMLGQQSRQFAAAAQGLSRDIGAGTTVATTAEHYKAPAELGDFELLRLAKMGDVESFKQFAQITGADVRTFTDNRAMNALHYAADAGSLALINHLREANVPYTAGENGLTPLAIAVLTGRSDVIAAALMAAAAASGHRDGHAPAPAFEELLAKFAPAPPRFVMSKPTPAPPPPSGDTEHAYWGCRGAGSRVPGAAKALGATSGSVLTAPAGVTLTTVVGGAEQPVEEQAVAAVRAVAHVAYQQHSTEAGPAAALAVLDTMGRSRLTLALAQQAAAEGGGEDTTVGAVAALRLGGTVSSSSSDAFGLPFKGLAVADHLAVSRDTTGRSPRGLPAALLHTLANALAADGSVGGVAFTSPRLLPTPPTAVCMVKYFRRGLDPLPVLRDYALGTAFFPDFARYEQTLRADAVLKGTLPAATRVRHEAAMLAWSVVDAADPQQVQLVCAFLATRTEAAGAQLFYTPETGADLTEGGLLGQGLHAYVRVDGATGAITDFIALRVRRGAAAEKRAAAEADNDADAVIVAQLVYAVHTSVSGTDKAEHLIIIARELLRAHVLLVPGLFGFTESDLVRSNFDELPAAREFVYVLAAKGGAVVAAPPVPAVKVNLPLFLL